MLKLKRAVLVYQAGIANVFAVECFNQHACDRKAKRLLQADFRSCEYFVKGLDAAGVKVKTLACNQAGDISEAHWSIDLNSQPFSVDFQPVFSRGVLNTDNRLK